MTPWSAAVERDGNLVRLSLLHTTDAGPARAFAPVIDVEIDETHAIILFGELGLALQAISDARGSRIVVPFPGKRT